MGCDEELPLGGHRLTTEERQRILRRLHSALGWVGVTIPEEVCLGGEQVELKDLVDRFVFDEHLDDQERQEAKALIDRIEERAEFLEDVLEERDMTQGEAEALFQKVIGLLRAVDELEHLEDDEGWEDKRRAVMEEVDDARRWKEFTKRVYHKDEYY